MIKLFNAIFLAGGQLRIDKDICYADAQYALTVVAASSATDIQLAVLRGKAQPNDELTKR